MLEHPTRKIERSGERKPSSRLSKGVMMASSIYHWPNATEESVPICSTRGERGTCEETAKSKKPSCACFGNTIGSTVTSFGEITCPLGERVALRLQTQPRPEVVLD